MKLLNLKLVIAVIPDGTASLAQDSSQLDDMPKMPPISHCSFLDIVQWNNLFLPIREIIFDLVVENVKQLDGLDDGQKAIREVHLNDLIEAAVVHHYNMISAPSMGNPEMELITDLYDDLINKIHEYISSEISASTLESYKNLMLSNVRLSEIPIKVFEFFRPLCVDLSNTCISDIKQLEQFPYITKIDLSHNNIKRIPRLDGFSSLEKIYLGYNPITIADNEKFVSNSKIACIDLLGIPNIFKFKERLESVFGHVMINDISETDPNVDSSVAPCIGQELAMRVMSSMQELILEWMRQWVRDRASLSTWKWVLFLVKKRQESQIERLILMDIEYTLNRLVSKRMSSRLLCNIDYRVLRQHLSEHRASLLNIGHRDETKQDLLNRTLLILQILMECPKNGQLVVD